MYNNIHYIIHTVYNNINNFVNILSFGFFINSGGNLSYPIFIAKHFFINETKNKGKVATAN